MRLKTKKNHQKVNLFMQYKSSTPTRFLYIHWPFCPYRCYFCPFVALAGQDNLMGVYDQALKKEIVKFAKEQENKLLIDTIHFGGGTPSTYPNDLLLDTFDILRNMFEIDDHAEIAIEVNPGTVDKEKLQVWQSVGINRLSIGVQSLKDQVLQKLNRHQTTQQVFDVLHTSAEVGFENVSVDLILGLPEVTPDEWKELINKVVTWPIKHVSIYCLEVHENTALYFKIKTNQVNLPQDEESMALYRWTCEFLDKYGFKQYELSNFAIPGYESRHNQAYWDRVPYKGFGIGACSFDGKRRFCNEKDIKKYLTAMQEGASCIDSCEELDERQAVLEHVMLNLRRPRGVLIRDIIDGMWRNKSNDGYKIIQQLEEQHFVERCAKQHIRLTSKGLVVENEVVAQLCRVAL